MNWIHIESQKVFSRKQLRVKNNLKSRKVEVENHNLVDQE